MVKPKKVLVDADALVAIAKEDDSNHSKAIRTSQKLKNDTLYITPFTIPESATVISHKVSHSEAKRFLIAARARNLNEIPLSYRAVKLADKIFSSQKNKGTSWVDCFNAALVKSLGLDGIFSFDKFYKRLGIKYF